MTVTKSKIYYQALYIADKIQKERQYNMRNCVCISLDDCGLDPINRNLLETAGYTIQIYPKFFRIEWNDDDDDNLLQLREE